MYQLDYVTPTYVLPPDPVEGNVYEYNFFLSITVHESFLVSTDANTVELSVYGEWYPEILYIFEEFYENGPPDGFGYVTSNDSMFHEIYLKLDTRSLQVLNWNLSFYEEYGTDYFSTPEYRIGDIYLEWDHWWDPETGSQVSFGVLAERYGLVDY